MTILFYFVQIVTSLTLLTTSRDQLAPSQNLSLQLDAPDDNNRFDEYIVYPESPQKIADISRKIEAIVKTGLWELIKSPSSPEWHDVLFWSLTIEDDEARRLKVALGSDVGLFSK